MIHSLSLLPYVDEHQIRSMKCETTLAVWCVRWWVTNETCVTVYCQVHIARDLRTSHRHSNDKTCSATSSTSPDIGIIFAEIFFRSSLWWL